MVRKENVPESRHGHTGEYELAGNTVATIDHIRRVLDEYDLSGCGARLSWPRPASRAEKDQLHLAASLPSRRPRPEGRTGHDRCPDEKSASIDSHLRVSSYPMNKVRGSSQQANENKLSDRRRERAWPRPKLF
jgi:hypothetical protein